MRISRAGWALMTALSLFIVFVAAKYLTFDPSVYFEQQREIYIDRALPLGLHVTGAIVALAIGPLQFATPIRRRLPRLHRTIGILYLLGCLAGGIGGLLLAPTAHGGPIATAGFIGLAVSWLVTGTMGLYMIRTGRVADHRRWMIRSFALTFSAVTLRLMLIGYATLSAAGLITLDFTTAYVAIAWLCWVPNLLIALHFTRSAKHPQPRESITV
ncbi:DUF2306 domain-containing protein [Nonomuraea sp. NPDC050790]|uniref:DUF2306 domain-containing protein n=1 Tax=Nonomuraea sp. NPDC050790 TaxID=3364371 RepID=UPI0037B39E90